MSNQVPDEASSYSVSLRLQRSIVETTFVSVPVTDDIMIRQADGTGRIDMAKLVERAIALSEQPGVPWEAESQQVQPHPIQMAPPRVKSAGGTAAGT